MEQKYEPMYKNRIRGIRCRASEQVIAKPISIKGTGRKFGGCVRKAVEHPGGHRAELGNRQPLLQLWRVAKPDRYRCASRQITVRLRARLSVPRNGRVLRELGVSAAGLGRVNSFPSVVPEALRATLSVDNERTRFLRLGFLAAGNWYMKLF